VAETKGFHDVDDQIAYGLGGVQPGQPFGKFADAQAPGIIHAVLAFPVNGAGRHPIAWGGTGDA
jgi:hypothetical protein